MLLSRAIYDVKGKMYDVGKFKRRQKFEFHAGW